MTIHLGSRVSLSERRAEIWNGINIAPETAMEYRRKWCREAGISLLDAYLLRPWTGDPPVETAVAALSCEEMAARLNAQVQKIVPRRKKYSRSTGKTRTVTEKIKVHQIPDDPNGVGTKFEEITKEFGLASKSSCTCTTLKNKMNDLGVEGCKRDREELIGKLKENYHQFSLAEKAQAAWNVFNNGIPVWLNPLKPVESMFDEAVRRAEQ